MAAANVDRSTTGPDCTSWFREHVQPHEAALRAYLRGRFPELPDVDDVIQDTYMRLLRTRAAAGVIDARPYLFSTARHAAIDFFRRRRILRLQPLGKQAGLSVVEDQPDAAEIVSHDQELALVREAVAALPPRCREVLVLRRFQGLSHRQIAQRLGIAEKTVDAHLGIALHRCRAFFAARGIPDGLNRT
jgi:RNA polymerase sigma factor (sigma-70 family)